MVSSRPVRPPAAEADARAPLVLAPFRGLRFNAAAVGDLGTVISPPYDVLDADTVRELEAGNRRNIVRLILARRFERPYLAVRKRLESWRAKAYLVADDTPALYLYQYTVAGTTVRGLIGLVGLRHEDEGVVLPHEDVMPGPVEDRTVLMRTTGTNPEPILLVHQGSARLRGVLESASRTPPLADFSAADGSHHRLWALTDATTLDRVAGELAPGQALIADGHHRYAAYLELQRELRGPASPPGSSPWDYGLAMLVDQNDYPLTVGPIHRSVSALTISDVQDLADERGDELVACPDRESAFTMAGAADPAADAVAQFVLSDGRAWAVLITRRGHPVDAAVLHEELLPAWNVSEEQIGYHHSIDQALQTTARQPGIVVAVHPPALDQVMATAAQGRRMPRKSTSFAPKPRMGLVLRDLRDA
jgi:uncharacterized protein (DUF1015 family)